MVDERLRSIHHESWNLDEIAQHVMRGHLLLPRFQRPYVWTDEQVTFLVDSLLRGFYVGSLILWKRIVSTRTQDMGGVRFTTRSDGYPVNIILDGQQRIVSAVRAIYTDRFFMDLRAGRVLVGVKESPWVVPLRNVLCWKSPGGDAMFFKTLDHAKRWGLDVNEVQHVVATMFDQFNSVRMSVAILEQSYTIPEVVEMFRRLNSAGTRMSETDLEHAVREIDSAI